MATRIAVVGAGYAGMAAAMQLAESGMAVTVFESSRTLGGRARGIPYRDRTLDNGQHILLGCYVETLSLIEKTAAVENPYFRMPLELNIDDFSMSALPFPPPFDLLFGLLFSKGLSLSAKLGAIKFLALTKSLKLEKDMAVAALLERYGQKKQAIDCLWAPLCVSALNTPIAKASANVFLAVLKDGLNGRGSDIVLPNVDLSSLFPNGAAKFIMKKGGRILTSTAVSSVRKTDGGFELLTGSGSHLFSHLILATAPRQARKLAVNFPEVDIPNFSYQPIVTVYSQYPEQVRLPQKMIGASTGLAHWFFDRGDGLIAAVISAEGEHVGLAQAELASRIHAEARNIVHDLPPPLWQKVIHEKHATFSCDVDVRRPEQTTSVPNLYLAGDYTAGNYPATLEGAVASGLACARMIIKAI